MGLLNRNDDGVVESLIKRFLSRSAKGIDTYGMTLEQNRMPVKDWNLYLQEELMDAILYIQTARDELRDITELEQFDEENYNGTQI